MLYGSYGYKQPIKIGVDTDAKHIGIAVISESRVLIKGEVELRDDIKSNLDTPAHYAEVADLKKHVIENVDFSIERDRKAGCRRAYKAESIILLCGLTE